MRHWNQNFGNAEDSVLLVFFYGSLYASCLEARYSKKSHLALVYRLKNKIISKMCVTQRNGHCTIFNISVLPNLTRGSPGHMEIGLDLWGPICLKTLLGIIMSAFVSLRMFWMWIILSTFLHYRFTKLTSSQLLFMKHIQFEVLLMTIYEPALKTTCIELLCFLYVSPYDLNFKGKYVMLFFILCGWITCWELGFLITSSRLLSFPQPLQTAHNSMEDLQSAFFFRLMNKFFLQISACKAVSIRSRIYP